ncbi:MAG: response regulator [Fimbriimonas sp.]
MSSNILIIDDETNIRLMMKLALEHSGYTVDAAADGQDGLIKFGDGRHWDLVLLDQRMPGLTGIEVQEEIYRRNRESRVILITAFGTIDLALEAIQAGASDFLRKPFTAETLRMAVKSALEKQVVHQTAVPVNLVCREFTRTTINGFGFEMDHEVEDEHTHDLSCNYLVSRAGQPVGSVAVVLPNYVRELVRAYTDSEHVPGGHRFWQAMCEESLANYLWQNAQIPIDGMLRIEDLSSSLQRWLDAVMTVSVAEENGR